MPVIEDILTEGALTFNFPENAMSSKYDEWSHYRNHFQRTCDSKAVDIVFANDGNAWLIEVKDYRRHARTKPTDLGQEIATKVRDTLAGLVSAKLNATDSDEKRMAGQLLLARRLHVVLHLEQPNKHSKLFPRAIDPADVELKLRTLLKAIDPHPKVVDRNSLHHTMNWTVS